MKKTSSILFALLSAVAVMAQKPSVVTLPIPAAYYFKNGVLQGEQRPRHRVLYIGDSITDSGWGRSGGSGLMLIGSSGTGASRAIRSMRWPTAGRKMPSP